MAGSTRHVTAHLNVEEGGGISGTIPLTQSDGGSSPTGG